MRGGTSRQEGHNKEEEGEGNREDRGILKWWKKKRGENIEGRSVPSDKSLIFG